MTHLLTSLVAELEAGGLSKADILCADLFYQLNCDYDQSIKNVQIVLSKNYTEEDYEKFVDGLDIVYDGLSMEYNPHDPCEEMFKGTVWLKNGGWITWGHDVPERWVLHGCPPISERCTVPKTKSSAKR